MEFYLGDTKIDGPGGHHADEISQMQRNHCIFSLTCELKSNKARTGL